MSIDKAWHTISTELTTPLGTYAVDKLAEGWTAVFFPRKREGGDTRSYEIDCPDVEGALWPTRETAQYACQAHQRHMAKGHSAAVAACMVEADLTREVG